MTQLIYIETSIVSYLTARPSNDMIKTACQHITRLWWDNVRLSNTSYVSNYVIEEASAGNSQAALELMNALHDIPVLLINQEILNLGEFLLLGGGFPAKAKIDAMHVACATYHQMDILLTWNCKHIANPIQLPIMRSICTAKGYKLPELVTPFELMGV